MREFEVANAKERLDGSTAPLVSLLCTFTFELQFLHTLLLLFNRTFTFVIQHSRPHIFASSHFCLFAFATKKMREYDDIIAKLRRRIIDSSVTPSPLHLPTFAIAPSHLVSPRFTSHLCTLGFSPSLFHLRIGVSLHFRSFAIALFYLCNFALSPLHLCAFAFASPRFTVAHLNFCSFAFAQFPLSHLRPEGKGRTGPIGTAQLWRIR